MRLSVLAALILIAPSLALALGAEPDAKTLAQEILDKGSALFDKRDPAAMAATYLENAEMRLIVRLKNQTEIKTEVKHGRSEIEKGYGDVFKDRQAETKSRNVVEYAAFLTPDVMVIHGKFQVDANSDTSFPFMQLRVKAGGVWLIQQLDLFVFEE